MINDPSASSILMKQDQTRIEFRALNAEFFILPDVQNSHFEFSKLIEFNPKLHKQEVPS